MDKNTENAIVEILTEIRDGIKDTNTKLDDTNKKLEKANDKADRVIIELWDLNKKFDEVILRQEKKLVMLAEAQNKMEIRLKKLEKAA